MRAIKALKDDLWDFCDDLIEYHNGDKDMISDVWSFRENILRVLNERQSLGSAEAREKVGP